MEFLYFNELYLMLKERSIFNEIFSTSTVWKVTEQINDDNSPSRRWIARYCHLNQFTVFRIIKSMNFVFRTQFEVHQLIPLKAKEHRQLSLRLHWQLGTNHYKKKSVAIDKKWFILLEQKKWEKLVMLKKDSD